jgi:hypothetical protein
MLQDEIIKACLHKVKARGVGEPFEYLYSRLLEGKAEPLLKRCRMRFEEVRWHHWVYKHNPYFADCAKKGLIKEGYLIEKG